MKVIYIAGPYRGKNSWAVEQHIRHAETFALAAAGLGVVALCPHSMNRYFDGTLTDAYWLEATAVLLLRADALLLIPGWQDSVGATAERDLAAERGIPLLYGLEELKKWLR